MGRGPWLRRARRREVRSSRPWTEPERVRGPWPAGRTASRPGRARGGRAARRGAALSREHSFPRSERGTGRGPEGELALERRTEGTRRLAGPRLRRGRESGGDDLRRALRARLRRELELGEQAHFLLPRPEQEAAVVAANDDELLLAREGQHVEDLERAPRRARLQVSAEGPAERPRERQQGRDRDRADEEIPRQVGTAGPTGLGHEDGIETHEGTSPRGRGGRGLHRRKPGKPRDRDGFSDSSFRS